MSPTSNAVDWPAFAAHHWNRRAAHLRGAAGPLDAGRAYETVVAAAEPFHAGTRFSALPNVRFYLAGGQLRAPGELLPGAADLTADHYATRLGERRCLLTVEQPLLLDFALWAQVRALVAPLWRLVGIPTVPVMSELVLAHRWSPDGSRPRPPYAAVLAWVLRGKVRLDVDGESDLLSGATGDLLYVPPGRRHDIEHSPDSLVLNLYVSADGRLAVSAVKDLLAASLTKRRGADSVPWLPYPPPRDIDGALPVIDTLADTYDALSELAAGPESTRLLRAAWAKRVSAGGLEPVPRPRTPVDVEPGQRVQVGHPILRMPDGRGLICAVNGHAFTVRGAEDVLAQLRTSDAVLVDVLCTGRNRDPVLTLLRRLYALRGIDLVTED